MTIDPFVGFDFEEGKHFARLSVTLGRVGIWAPAAGRMGSSEGKPIRAWPNSRCSALLPIGV